MAIADVVEEIDKEIAVLNAARKLLVGGTPSRTRTPARKPMSAAARKRISRTQKKRWKDRKATA